MAKRIKTYIQFRRGTAEEWNRVNPILMIGEPGYAFDVDGFKIGDGIHEWKQLPWKNSSAQSGNGGVFNAETHFDFPSIGAKDTLYLANQEGKVYYWIEEKLTYEPINTISSITDIELIDGGNAAFSTNK